jgi:septum formation protein
LLRSLNFEVSVIPSGYAEPDRPELSPRELAIAHAREKLLDVAKRVAPDDAVLAADTVVDVDGAPYNKPLDDTDAKRMLRDLSGRTHLVHTAYALKTASGCVEHCETSAVTFFALDGAEIDAYVGTGEPLDKAGAYGIQGYGATLVARVDGDFYTVMGLPLAHVAKSLRRLGFALPLKKRAFRPI